MFRFKELSLHGWDLWPAVRMPLDRDVVLVTGPNGSGKTTLLDAIRLLLNAPKLSARRRSADYLRRPSVPALIRAVISNEPDGSGGPPFRRERVLAPEATIACALVPASGGAPERRFAIMEGRVPADVLQRKLLDSRDYYEPNRYSSALEQAGVKKSLMGVLAIEQGQTNSLFDLKPRELFARVLDMLGDHAVLKRYQDARDQYQRTRQEVAAQAGDLQTLQTRLNQLARLVHDLETWESQRQKVQELEARVPAADLQVALQRGEEAVAKVPELRTKVQNGQVECFRLEADERLATEREDAARELEADAKRAYGLAHEAHSEALKDEATANTRLGDLEEKALRLAAVPIGDIATLEQRHDVTFEELARATAHDDACRNALADATRRLQKLQSGQHDLPGPVEVLLDSLARRGIGADLLARQVEMDDDAAGPAVESALGDARFTLLVDPANRAAAIELADQCAYPGPIYAGSTIETSVQVGPLLLTAGAPSWLPPLADQLHPNADGSWTDDRGWWANRRVDRVLGATGLQAALLQAERDAETSRHDSETADARLRSATEAHRIAEDAIRVERERQVLGEEVARLPDLRSIADRSRGAAKTAAANLELALSERDDAIGALKDATIDLTAVRKQLGETRKLLAGETKALRDLELEAAACEEKARDLGKLVREDLRERAARRELDGPETVSADLERARRDLASLGEPPSADVRAEHDHHRRNVEQAERHLMDRDRELREADEELTLCRQRYLEVVSHTLLDYRRRAVELGREADVRVEMELPKLVDDDRALAEAGIEASFGFDGKDPLPMRHSSFSGGQQVIAGLVLLMAMAETEGRGFFMLDEPFAHLSLDRVDQVGRFLRNSRSQFILTAPTTLDRVQLDPASLVIVLRKKHPDETFAPVPIVAEA